MLLNGTLGRSIRAMRKMKGLTQEELAKQVGMKRSSISGIEGGRQVLSERTLNSIADVLGYRVHVTFRQKPTRTHSIGPSVFNRIPLE